MGLPVQQFVFCRWGTTSQCATVSPVGINAIPPEEGFPRMRAKNGHRDPAYSTRSVVRACEILKCFKRNEELGLDEVAARCQLSKPTAYRLLRTLVECGMLKSLAKNVYSSTGGQSLQWKFRFGYASQTEEFSFSRLVSDSIRSCAYEAGVELLVLDNCYSSKIAIRNAETFVREQVDLVIEFQTSLESSSFVASRIEEAGIPLIAIDIPHPGADYFGANNYRAGLLGGQALAQACFRQWDSKVDEVVLLDLPMAGPLVRSRLSGMLAGLRELRLNIRDESVHFIDGNGRFEKSWDVMRRYLRRSRSTRTLVGAVNDPSCLGALRAFEEAGRAEQCLAVSQNACIEARREMRQPKSRLVASVGFFPERYGETVIALALDKIQGRHIPSATFVKHQVITVENVDKFYPNDKLIPNGDSDSLLWSQH